MTQLLRVQGTRSELLGLLDSPGVHVAATSAVKGGDGRWSVSAYAPDDAAGDLRSRGLSVDVLKREDHVANQWAAAGGGGYLDSAGLAARLDALAQAHAGICSVEVLDHRTHEGREVRALTIGTGPADRTVVAIGGVHAREWAPPDALLSLGEGLVTAYAEGRALEYPEWVDATAQPPIPYAAWSVPAADLKQLLEAIRLVLVPLVNPDGRDFSLQGADDLHYMWRKNRRPPAAGAHGEACHGVDVNRNFDVAWDFDRYYNPAAASQVAAKKNPCDPELYIGPSAASEPETLNVQSLVDRLRPVHFLDVHAYSRDILYPWGMDDDQAGDPTQSFQNADWDRTGVHGGRDGLGGVYGEYMPAALAARHKSVATRMRDAIREQAGADAKASHRSDYTIKQELGLYPTTGTTDDYCVKLSMLDPARPPILAFALECGIDQAADDPTDDEGGFHPDYTANFPKIEREVHAAVLTLARVAAS